MNTYQSKCGWWRLSASFLFLSPAVAAIAVVVKLVRVVKLELLELSVSSGLAGKYPDDLHAGLGEPHELRGRDLELVLQHAVI
ncbi:hypothetical protein DFH11DRAFT_270238 [Phellopilus nigrolimitatus]|nr:hypothetical protein DFH11DRAFT_270238 [Phellopilus nigrolimitatus]